MARAARHGAAHVRELAALHRLHELAEGPPEPERVLAPHRHRGHLRGGHRGQRAVLPEDRAAAPGRAAARLRPDRAHERLADEPADRQRLARAARPLDAAELRELRGVDREEPELRPGQPLHDPVAVRLHRDRLQRQPHRPRDHERPRPVGPRVPRPGGDDERQHRPRLGRAALPRHRPGHLDRLRLGAGGRRTPQAARARAGATTTSATSTRSSAATPGSARPGRATSSRRTPPATPSSGSWCPRRASCTGPTT